MGDRITISIVYDNIAYEPRFKEGWGFACVIRGASRNILFDTGGDGETLMMNMAELGIDPGEIAMVMLSHAHGDHANGLVRFLEAHRDVPVFLPSSFPDSFRKGVTSLGADVKDVRSRSMLAEGIYTTGEMGMARKEQSLAIVTPNGAIGITGCAHPGIVSIARAIKNITDSEIYLLLGGFHFPKPYVAEELKEIGVTNVAPCHCSGAEARVAFRESFGENFIEIGAGRELTI